ncbi:MAG: transporter permease subunit [Acidobacteriota bacterium]|nr:transporter permease subunit [Acidobacteriota bacterium]
MKGLFAVQISEEKQALSRINIVVALLILAMGLGLLQIHVSEYKKKEDQKAVFQDVEKNKVDQFTNYRQYGFFGFRLLFLADPLSTLFMNSTVVQDMTAYIDSGERLNIYQSLKSHAPFNVTKFLFADCSGIYLCFLGLLAIFYGYMAFLHTEYLKFLASITGIKKLFRSIYLSRASILVQFTLIYLASAVLLITINGVAIDIDQYLVVLFIKMCGVSLAFFAAGAVLGLCESIFVGLFGAIASWFIPLLIIPFIVSVIVSSNAATIKPENQLELEKLKLMMSFEKSSNEKAGILKISQQPTDIDRELVESYYKNEFQKIKVLEEEVKAQMQECAKLHYLLSAFFPTTGYLALTQEISSKGYENLDAFYQAILLVKEAFFKEYMKQVYFSSSSEPAKVEPFLKGDENIFVGKPALPGYWLLYFFIDLLWIVGLAMLAYVRFNKSLFGLPEKKKNIEAPRDIALKRGQIIEWSVSGNLLNRILYSMMSNETRDFKKKGYSFLVTLDDQVLNTAAMRQIFLYLCHPKEIPGYIKVKNFLNLVMDLMKVEDAKRKEIIARFSLESIENKKFRKLDIEELGNVFLAILEMKAFDVYLIDDIGRGMLGDFCFDLKTKMDDLWSSSGAAVLFIASDFYYLSKESIKKGYFEHNGWLNKVESIREIYRGQKTE